MFDLKCFIKDSVHLKSVLTLAHNGKKASYEQLEFLGDRVLGLIVADMLYHQYPNESEGSWAHRFTELVREETLSAIAKQLNLPDFLITNEPELRHNSSVLADVCEAVLGALYLEKGLEETKNLVLPLWTPIMLSYVQAPKDFKSTLQEWTQKKGWGLPVYQVLQKSGTEHEPLFTVSVTAGTQTAAGTGTSKKEAQQQAAEAFLKSVEKEKI